MTYVKSGVSHHPLAATHYGMMRRCYDPDYSGYRNYGGRGIQVCREWHSLKTFVAWYDSLPSNKKRKPGETLERRNNSEGYSPGNCYFATKQRQERNKRTTLRTTFRRKTMAIADVYDILKSEGKIPARLTIDAIKTRRRKYGWSWKKCFSKPFAPDIVSIRCIVNGKSVSFRDYYKMESRRVKYTTALARFKRGYSPLEACNILSVRG